MKKKNSGIALIFVMVFTVAISTLVIFFQGRSKNYTNIFVHHREHFLLEEIAELGIEIGKELIKVDKKNFPITGEEQDPAVKERQYEIKGVYLYVTIHDENSKINPNKVLSGEKEEVNTLLMDVFKRFFVVAGHPETLCNSILDWIDKDDIPRPGGAESFYYKNEGLSYTPYNRGLYTVDELPLIKDITEEMVYGNTEEEIKGLINFITFFSDGKINVNTCPAEILGALGFTEANRETIVTERARRPIEEGFLVRVNKGVYLKNKSLIVFKSKYFLVESVAVDDNKGLRKQARGYIKLTDKKTDIARMEVK